MHVNSNHTTPPTFATATPTANTNTATSTTITPAAPNQVSFNPHIDMAHYTHLHALYNSDSENSSVGGGYSGSGSGNGRRMYDDELHTPVQVRVHAFLCCCRKCRGYSYCTRLCLQYDYFTTF